MKALVVIAHGSRNPLANEELQKMVLQLSQQPENNQFDFFKAGYLELASPSINECLDELLEKGVTEFVIFPYFLNSGVHVLKDIPKVVTHYQTTYPDHQFSLLTHFGAAPGILGLVTQLVAQG
ncbi:sirohydrochlorin chelatase [Motilimonas sp. 1_MG-2023]|uniref:sirohydrochlorin chelatase n=1 Tax=Motilimonas TaxID=1914248 RepID=UPI0026E20F35|nr:CbiX/SirB N-terminal domain-containing protein [Motilimonas sp. 1_MG-2023]MDO6527854.1 CbiX/SirB N-terminal domain-containing protein [Motilimonas sp. 1_MG-2023]